MRIALLTYCTRPRGSVVHTLSLAEALAHLGQQVTVHGLGRSGDTAFFRPLDPRVRTVVTPLPDQPEEDLDAKVGRSIAVLGAAADTGTYVDLAQVHRTRRGMHHLRDRRPDAYSPKPAVVEAVR